MPTPNGMAPAPNARHSLTRSGSFRFILLLGLLDAFGPLGIDMYLPAFPQIEQDLQAHGGAMQLTLSLFLAGLAIGQLICGPISDRVGRRGPLLYGSVAFAAASLLCAFSTSIEALIAARFLMGLAGSTGMVVARAVVRDSFEEAESARVYSLLMLVIGIAPIISPTFGNWLMQFGSWPVIFWALAAFGCVCGIAVALDLPETLPVERRSQTSLLTIGRHYVEMLVDFRFMGYALPVSFALGQIFAYVASAPSLFMEIYGLSPNAFTLTFASNAIGLIGAAQVNRWLTRQLDTHVILRGALLVNVASSLLLPFLASTGLGGFPVFLGTLFVCLTSLGFIFPNATAAVMAPFPNQAGAASALLGMLQFAVGAGTGAVVGIFADGTPLPMAWTMAACATLSLLVALKVEWQRRQAIETDAAQSPDSSSKQTPVACLSKDNQD
ncbi:Bcr/CflA family multidrug efflux MFS transporter [Planctomicrobium piriforme]|uniref:MFS transporter, DHA1 family, bicyclomycin/chloramphenicol resistance protein n=1 Tax=Planctomicrobium piriforme TaxID=1576369 RepID=A0A1I3K1Y8_9PLAN|nr:Bcr/CflA family multidrug efflux MFS transporter [Planctomicrobium piriforme]SFI66195.1 MFS transporter, DHA1 family, bicyclomycin/chloramphenicol resistance protein [Planctomicrobium piriforme]